MKAKRKSTTKSERPKPLAQPEPAKEPPTSPPLPPVGVVDLAEDQPPITQSELLAFGNAHHCFNLARADFEAKRAALTLKLLRFSECQAGCLFVRLDPHGNLIFENRESINLNFGEPATDTFIIPSSGPA